MKASFHNFIISIINIVNLKIPYSGQVSLQYEIGEENDLVFNKGIELDREILLEFNEGKLIKEK